MRLLLLDTTFLIDAERSGSDLDGVIDDDDDVAIAAITVAELLVGVELAPRRHKAQRRSYAQAVVEGIPLIPYDLAIAKAHAVLLAEVRTQGRPRGAHDLIIAATARATNRTVLSADRTAFDDLPGIEVLDYRR